MAMDASAGQPFQETVTAHTGLSVLTQQTTPLSPTSILRSHAPCVEVGLYDELRAAAYRGDVATLERLLNDSCIVATGVIQAADQLLPGDPFAQPFCSSTSNSCDARTSPHGEEARPATTSGSVFRLRQDQLQSLLNLATLRGDTSTNAAACRQVLLRAVWPRLVVAHRQNHVGHVSFPSICACMPPLPKVRRAQDGVTFVCQRCGCPRQDDTCEPSVPSSSTTFADPHAVASTVFLSLHDLDLRELSHKDLFPNSRKSPVLRSAASPALTASAATAQSKAPPIHGLPSMFLPIATGSSSHVPLAAASSSGQGEPAPASPDVLRSRPVASEASTTSTSSSEGSMTSSSRLKRSPREAQLAATNHLQLSANQLRRIATSILQAFPLLRSLDLSRNLLSQLPAHHIFNGKSCWQHLRVLRLRHNRIRDLPLYIYELPALVVLDAAHNYISNISQPFSSIHLRHLDLSHNELNNTAVRLLHSVCLERVYISHNRIQTLSGAMDCPLLQHLDVSHNMLANADFLQRLSATFPALKTLDLSSNIIRAVPRAALPSLRWLSLADNLCDSWPIELGGDGNQVDLGSDRPGQGLFQQLSLCLEEANIVSRIKELSSLSLPYVQVLVTGLRGHGSSGLIRSIAAKCIDTPIHRAAGPIATQMPVIFASWDSRPGPLKQATRGSKICFVANQVDTEWLPMGARLFSFSLPTVVAVAFSVEFGLSGMDELFETLKQVSSHAPAAPVVVACTHMDRLFGRLLRRAVREGRASSRTAITKEAQTVIERIKTALADATESQPDLPRVEAVVPFQLSEASQRGLATGSAPNVSLPSAFAPRTTADALRREILEAAAKCLPMGQRGGRPVDALDHIQHSWSCVKRQQGRTADPEFKGCTVIADSLLPPATSSQLLLYREIQSIVNERLSAGSLPILAFDAFKELAIGKVNVASFQAAMSFLSALRLVEVISNPAKPSKPYIVLYPPALAACAHCFDAVASISPNAENQHVLPSSVVVGQLFALGVPLEAHASLLHRLQQLGIMSNMAVLDGSVQLPYSVANTAPDREPLFVTMPVDTFRSFHRQYRFEAHGSDSASIHSATDKVSVSRRSASLGSSTGSMASRHSLLFLPDDLWATIICHFQDLACRFELGLRDFHSMNGLIDISDETQMTRLLCRVALQESHPVHASHHDVMMASTDVDVAMVQVEPSQQSHHPPQGNVWYTDDVMSIWQTGIIFQLTATSGFIVQALVENENCVGVEICAILAKDDHKNQMIGASQGVQDEDSEWFNAGRLLSTVGTVLERLIARCYPHLYRTLTTFASSVSEDVVLPMTQCVRQAREMYSNLSAVAPGADADMSCALPEQCILPGHFGKRVSVLSLAPDLCGPLLAPAHWKCGNVCTSMASQGQHARPVSPTGAAMPQHLTTRTSRASSIRRHLGSGSVSLSTEPADSTGIVDTRRHSDLQLLHLEMDLIRHLSDSSFFLQPQQCNMSTFELRFEHPSLGTLLDLSSTLTDTDTALPWKTCFQLLVDMAQALHFLASQMMMVDFSVSAFDNIYVMTSPSDCSELGLKIKVDPVAGANIASVIPSFFKQPSCPGQGRSFHPSQPAHVFASFALDVHTYLARGVGVPRDSLDTFLPDQDQLEQLHLRRGLAELLRGCLSTQHDHLPSISQVVDMLRCADTQLLRWGINLPKALTPTGLSCAPTSLDFVYPAQQERPPSVRLRSLSPQSTDSDGWLEMDSTPEDAALIGRTALQHRWQGAESVIGGVLGIPEKLQGPDLSRCAFNIFGGTVATGDLFSLSAVNDLVEPSVVGDAVAHCPILCQLFLDKDNVWLGTQRGAIVHLRKDVNSLTWKHIRTYKCADSVLSMVACKRYGKVIAGLANSAIIIFNVDVSTASSTEPEPQAAVEEDTLSLSLADPGELLEDELTFVHRQIVLYQDGGEDAAFVIEATSAHSGEGFVDGEADLSRGSNSRSASTSGDDESSCFYPRSGNTDTSHAGRLATPETGARRSRSDSGTRRLVGPCASLCFVGDQEEYLVCGSAASLFVLGTEALMDLSTDASDWFKDAKVINEAHARQKGHSDLVQRVEAVSANRVFSSMRHNSRVCVWDVSHGKLALIHVIDVGRHLRLGSHACRVTSSCFVASEQQLWIGTKSGCLLVFKLKQGRPLTQMAQFNSLSGAVRVLEVVHDVLGRPVVVSCSDSSARIGEPLALTRDAAAQKSKANVFDENALHAHNDDFLPRQGLVLVWDCV